VNVSKARSRLRNLSKNIRGIFGEHWDLPDLSQLPDTNEEIVDNCMAPVSMQELQDVLNSFGVPATVSDFFLGSSVTTFQLELPKGFRLSRLTANEDDIARDLGVNAVRVNPNCRGKIGIEIENSYRLTVGFKELAQSIPAELTIPIILGEDTLGNPQYIDMTDLPHLLVAGATGSGKSVFLHSMICSILATRTPDQVKLLMIDPKQVEFQPYRDVPHLLEPAAHETHEAMGLLNQVVETMEERFELLTKHRARKISELREKSGIELPYIVFVIDEYADLMLMGSTKERKAVEQKIARIAQKARAVGIHLVLTTQKPLATVVTSVLKANLQARAAFSVATGTDSRVVLDQNGAEQLSGKGDMLFKNSTGHTTRIQAPWMPDRVIDYITGERR
jgi:S-DNA-T family DNA segregation ATPase FtsK/SpoIIIE